MNRPFQETGIAKATEVLNAGGRKIYSAPTGSGKTPIELALLARFSESALITPRKEIIRGMLRKQGVETEGLSEEKLFALAEEARIWTPIRLRNRLADGSLRRRPQQVIWDECFPAGTLVEGRPIETLRPGDAVLAFNTYLNEPVGTVVRRLLISRTRGLVRLWIGGESLVATMNHPFWTHDGAWLPAEDLLGKEVLRVNVYHVRETKRRAPDLLDDVLGPLFLGTNDANQPAVHVGSDEGTESDAPARDSREGSEGTSGSPVGPAREAGRQWAPATPAAEAPGRGFGLGDRADRSDWSEGVRAPDAFQDRRRESAAASCSRGGRSVSQREGSAGAGSTEGSVAAWARVDRVEVLEPGSDGTYGGVCPDGVVYNLEVGGPHNFCVGSGFLVHNCHHSSADSYEDVSVLLGRPPAVGFTATPFRGSPKETLKLRELWGEPEVLLTIREAADAGYISPPRVSVIPLCDDDVVSVSNGDFVVKAAGDLVGSRAAAIAEVVARYFDAGDAGAFGGIQATFQYDKPTLLAFPSSESLYLVSEYLTSCGVPWVAVTQKTSDADRQEAFARTLRCEAVLLQIDVVSEGVDEPFARLIDCRPTLSPVRFLQQVGRIMRPGLDSEYICLCRNLERHCYLLAGILPLEAVAAAQKAFGQISERTGSRVLGLEALGRFKASDVKTHDGCTIRLYQVQALVENRLVQFAAIVHPALDSPIVAARMNGEAVFAEGQLPKRPWARWSPARLPPDLQGFASAPRGPLTPKMKDLWAAQAKYRGLDTAQDVSRHSFAVLPILMDLNRRL